MDDHNWLYQGRDGKARSATRGHLLRLLAEGSVTSATQVRRDERSSWAALSTILHAQQAGLESNPAMQGQQDSQADAQSSSGDEVDRPKPDGKLADEAKRILTQKYEAEVP